jgi:hypothetical protein
MTRGGVNFLGNLARQGANFRGEGANFLRTGTKNCSDRSEVIPLTGPNRLSLERDVCKHKYISDRGLGCALGFGTMHAHRSIVKRKMVGKGINCFIHTGLMWIYWKFRFSSRSHESMLLVSSFERRRDLMRVETIARISTPTIINSQALL